MMKRIRKIIAVMLLGALCLCMAVSSAAEDLSLVTVYSANAQGFAILFDLEAQNCQSLTITSLGINLTQETTHTLYVYYREGGYEGYEKDSSAWTLLGSATITGQGKNNETTLPVGGLTLLPGVTYGICIRGESSSDINALAYSTCDSDTVYQDTYLTLTPGASLFGFMISPSLAANRLFNGTIDYTVVQIPQTEENNDNDSNQDNDTTADDQDIPQTGDAAGRRLWIWAIAAALSFAAIGFVVCRYVNRQTGTRL